MMNFAKQWVLRSLDQAGYRLLKKADHDALQAAAASSRSVPAPEPPAPVPAVSPSPPPPPPPPAAPAAPAAPNITGLDLTAAAGHDAALAAFLAQTKLDPARALALYRIVQYLAHAKIPGDIVDSGHGATATLSAIAAASVDCRDTGRKLVLFDASVDPLHRAETELDLWGSERDLITDPPAARRQQPEPPPPELVAAGYPSGRIDIRRYPREPIAQTAPIAFLNLTAETYPANRKAIATFVPKVSPGGVIAVTGNSPRDAVTEFLAAADLHLLFVPVTADFRVAVRS